MNILKGFIIGIGKIIPGVSGAMLAMSLGVYEKSIKIISSFDIKNNFKFLLQLGIGFVIAILLMSRIIIYFLDNYYLPTMLLFIGLIIGGFPSILKKVNKVKIFYFMLSFIFVYFLSFIGSQNSYIETNVLSMLLLGFIDAFTMIVPGISGTAVMMILGCYDIYIELLSKINLLFIPFIFSLGISVVFISKGINILLESFKDISYSLILGFSLSSIIFLIIPIFEKTSTILELVLGIVLFIVGAFVSLNLEK